MVVICQAGVPLSIGGKAAEQQEQQLSIVFRKLPKVPPCVNGNMGDIITCRVSH